MRLLNCQLIALCIGLFATPAIASTCANNPEAIGLARIVEIDTSSGPLFGAITKQPKQESFLGPKEVVLTFDDGPSPWVTTAILKVLAEHCTRASFFHVGKMAIAYPDLVRDVLDQGHTVGTHTWSHPFNLPAMNAERAHSEIDDGFAAVTAAAGRNIAPFFRFTGLRDSKPLLAYLRKRGIATFTVDVVSDDSFISDWQDLVEVTLRRVTRANGGIILFHDIKPATAKALPHILAGLKSRGFKVVHMRPRHSLEVPDSAIEKFAGRVALNLSEARREERPQLMPFYGAVAALRESRGDEPLPKLPDDGPPVTVIVPEDPAGGADASTTPVDATAGSASAPAADPATVADAPASAAETAGSRGNVIQKKDTP